MTISKLPLFALMLVLIVGVLVDTWIAVLLAKRKFRGREGRE